MVGGIIRGINSRCCPGDCRRGTSHRRELAHGTAGVPCFLARLRRPGGETWPSGGQRWCTEPEGRSMGKFPGHEIISHGQQNDVGPQRHFAPQHLQLFMTKGARCESCRKPTAFVSARSVTRYFPGREITSVINQITAFDGSAKVTSRPSTYICSRFDRVNTISLSYLLSSVDPALYF